MVRSSEDYNTTTRENITSTAGLPLKTKAVKASDWRISSLVKVGNEEEMRAQLEKATLLVKIGREQKKKLTHQSQLLQSHLFGEGHSLLEAVACVILNINRLGCSGMRSPTKGFLFGKSAHGLLGKGSIKIARGRFTWPNDVVWSGSGVLFFSVRNEKYEL